MLRCVLQSWTVLPSQKRLSPSKRLLPHRRTQLGRLNSYSLDDLFEQLKKELGHDNLLDQDLLEESGTETKRPKFDFANQQQLWPSGQDGSGFVTIGPRNYGPDPEKGTEQHQITESYEDAMQSDSVDPSHSRYWFTEPAGGWSSRPKTYKAIEEHPGFFANAKSFQPNQKPLSELNVGDAFQGVVSEIWYHHGVKVNIGFELDGLLPMYKETWAEFGKRLDVGDRVNVEVVRLWKADLYRWPIELKALNPEIQKFMIPSKEWDPPIDMRGKTVSEIERHSNRRLPSVNWYLPDDMDADANPYHNTARIEDRLPPLPFEDEEWEDVQMDYGDDMVDAALSIQNVHF